jgi:purine-binding chemotaxis protein CheW
LDSTAQIPDAPTIPTLLFRVGQDLYGSKVTSAQEAIPLRKATRIPGAPPFVRGLINVRGTIVTVIDLGVRLEASRSASDDGSILLVRQDAVDRIVGVVVDEVLDVRSLSIDEGLAPRGANGGMTSGLAMIDDTTVVILDLDVLISQILLS